MTASVPLSGRASAGLTDPASGLRARIAADVDAPDRVAFDLTLRQIAVLAASGCLALMAWAALTPWAPVPVRVAAVVPFTGVGLALAAGRRDGLPLDSWLLAAARFRRSPATLLPALTQPLPDWGPVSAVATAGSSRAAAGRSRHRGPDRGGDRPPGLLRLPARAVDDDGTVHLRTGRDDAACVLVASTTVNIGLRTPGEQAALVAGFGRWLNGLTLPVQVVVSTRRVDLTSHATRLAVRARDLNPSLAAAAIDHAEFLLDLAEARDPLARTVTITTTATGGPAPEVAARRAAEHTVAALTPLGAQAVILDGPTATAALTAATDPYQATDAGWARTPPGAVVTGRPSRRPDRPDRAERPRSDRRMVQP